MSRTIRRQFLYWTTQFTVWAAYVTLISSVAYADEKYAPGTGYLMTMVLLIGIGVSHLFRLVILKLRWIDLSLGGLLLRIVAGSLVLGALAFLLQAILHDVLFPLSTPIIGGDPFGVFTGWVNWILLLFGWGMGYFSYHWFVRSRREEIRNLRLEGANRENQLGTLRSQLNPHFMFNALNGIRALIDEDPARAKQSITQLSTILRNSMMTVRRNTVPLGEELDIVKAYLDLEAMRFEERLRVRYDVEDGLDRLPVPPMMLQTLAENAVRHGIAHLTAGGDLEIGAHRTLEGLLLSVKNTGTYDPSAPKKLGTTSNGIGLRNTRRRLEMLYGRTAELRIENRDGMVVTEVEIPIATGKSVEFTIASPERNEP